LEPSAKSFFTIADEQRRDELATLLSPAGVGDWNAILLHAVQHLDADWLTIWDGEFVRLKTAVSAQQAVHITVWTEILWALHHLRNYPSIMEHVRRLNLVSWEKVNHAIVFLIAARYLFFGYSVRLEPNGPKGSDLLIEGNGFRTYAEIKHENIATHKRFTNWWNRARHIADRVLADHKIALRSQGSRLEMHFGGMFSDETIPRILQAVGDAVRAGRIGEGVAIPAVADSRCRLVRRDTPFSVAPASCTFCAGQRERNDGSPTNIADADVVASIGMPPNLDAIIQNVKTALRQLARERTLDPAATSMIVIHVMDPNYVSLDIVRTMAKGFPRELIGLVAVSFQEVNWMLAREEYGDSARRFLQSG
jgi:hypothetical protein